MLKKQLATSDPVKFLAACGLLAPVVFAIILTIGGFVYEAYSHSSQTISELGGLEAGYPAI